MHYDTQIIYGHEEKNELNTFQWDCELYYRTKKGKPKKKNHEGKNVSISEEELLEAQNEYNIAFNKNISI